MRLSGLPDTPTNPVIISLRKTVSRQCESAVPGPPVFSTGTGVGLTVAPFRRPNSFIAAFPRNVGFVFPALLSKDLKVQTVPIPSTCPIVGERR
jgi:hypothetical protein